MLPAQQPDRPLASSAPTVDRPPLVAVPPHQEDRHEVPHEDGLVRSVVLGAAIGFTTVFVMVCAGLLLADMGLAYVLPSATFVAAFGGIGFGGMQAAALHKPRSG